MKKVFPAQPVVGEVFTNDNGYTWVYGGKGWKTVGVFYPVKSGGGSEEGSPGITGATGATGSAGITGATGPAGPPGENSYFYQPTTPTENLHNGAMWFNTDDGKVYVYTFDGTNYFWIQING